MQSIWWAWGGYGSKKEMQPYLKLIRIYRPIGIFLLFWPSAFAIILAGKFDFYKLLVFAIGSLIMRSCGCIINDLLDADIDKLVERTKMRPIASGVISKTNALIFLSFLLTIALALLLTLNKLTIILGFSSLIFVFLYPLMKRVTNYPQIFLGLTYNFGALMGYASITNRIDPQAISLYFACLCWTVVYDTIYAYQDIDDDRKIGVKSTAITFGYNKKYLYFFLSLMSIGFVVTGALAGLNKGFYLGITLIMIWLFIQMRKLDLYNKMLCARAFDQHQYVGLAIFLAMYLMK